MFIKSFFYKGHIRTIQAKKNIAVAFVCKGFSVLVSFLIVPLTLKYVGKVEYGIWMIISSIIHWFNFFDIGLGNGLRNKLAETLALKDKERAKIYISSVFVLITIIAIVLFLGFFVFSHLISWNKILNTDHVPNSELSMIMIIVFFFFCIEFILKPISSILQALQKYAINDILGLFAQILGLLAIFVLVKTTHGSLLGLCLVYGGKMAIVLLIASVFLFHTILKEYRPSLKYIQLNKALPLLHLGIKFFIIQILYIVLTQSSVILIAQFFGPSDVTIYNLAVRYMTIFSMLYMMVLSPFLTAFTEAYTKHEYVWIKNTLKKINKIWLLASLGTLVLVLVHGIFFKLWLGDTVAIPLYLIIGLFISVVSNMWMSTYTLFLNSLGKIHLQLYIYIVEAVLFIPLSFLFYKMGFELISIVVVQIIFYIISGLIYVIQCKKIMHCTAIGIWNK